MKIYKLKSVNTNYNPLDLVEDIIIANGWDYERDSNNNIHVEVAGEWCDYQLSYGINEDHNLLYISCVLDINIPENRFKDVYSFLFSLNERLLVGHFEIWSDQSWPILKQSIPIPTNQSLCKNQLEQASLLALRECEKFYPAFQLAVYGDKTPKEAIQVAIAEAFGRA